MINCKYSDFYAGKKSETPNSKIRTESEISIENSRDQKTPATSLQTTFYMIRSNILISNSLWTSTWFCGVNGKAISSDVWTVQRSIFACKTWSRQYLAGWIIDFPWQLLNYNISQHFAIYTSLLIRYTDSMNTHTHTQGRTKNNKKTNVPAIYLTLMP